MNVQFLPKFIFIHAVGVFLHYDAVTTTFQQRKQVCHNHNN